MRNSSFRISLVVTIGAGDFGVQRVLLGINLEVSLVCSCELGYQVRLASLNTALLLAAISIAIFLHHRIRVEEIGIHHRRNIRIAMLGFYRSEFLFASSHLYWLSTIIEKILVLETLHMGDVLRIMSLCEMTLRIVYLSKSAMCVRCLEV